MTNDSEPTVPDRALGDESPTTVQSPVAPRRASEPAPAVSSGTAGAFRTAEATVILGREEASRTLALLRLVGLIGLVGLVVVWIPRADTPFRLVAAVTFGATLVVTLALLWRFRDPSRFDTRLVLVYGLFCVASVLAATLYVGIFSPTIMGACVGIYFFGLSDSAAAGWTIYSTVSGGYALMAGLAIAGVIPVERAVVAVEHPDRMGFAALTLAAELLLALTFGMARRSRRATREAFERLEQAGMQIRQREALLAEARADLDAARAAKLGRYSDRNVGDYAVGEVIGRGAMGEVYRGRELRTDRPVALKFVSTAMLGEREFLERFFREARVASSLSSPHVVEVLASGHADDGAPFIAMELLEGSDLAERLRGQKRLPLAEVLVLVNEVAQALAVADQAGIVHRDIKPHNLFWAEQNGRQLWKVLDFGVSKVREATAQLTQGAAIGTPSYMSPEQARGQDVDHRSDVFSLGVIAYRCLTGRPAFTAGDSVLTIYNVVHVQPARPSDFVAEISLDVERVLALALAKDRERRLTTATMLAASLADAARERLDARLRADADALIAEAPWGADLAALKRVLRLL